ncbi:hypothetical protein JOB18_030755 [Solea senegalensis]|uniref:Uncharacterized protein n=1 Tax=Solea senegalensis TaxID=28829 RepID=A0AAV6RE85_SOLSE|nr:hypothetical protein JOB18_030755 [Solea senegalensis]
MPSNTPQNLETTVLGSVIYLFTHKEKFTTALTSFAFRLRSPDRRCKAQDALRRSATAKTKPARGKTCTSMEPKTQERQRSMKEKSLNFKTARKKKQSKQTVTDKLQFVCSATVKSRFLLGALCSTVKQTAAGAARSSRGTVLHLCGDIFFSMSGPHVHVVYDCTERKSNKQTNKQTNTQTDKTLGAA